MLFKFMFILYFTFIIFLVVFIAGLKGFNNLLLAIASRLIQNVLLLSPEFAEVHHPLSLV